MLTFFLSVLGIGRSVITAVMTWLSRRSLAELASLALVIVCLVLLLSLKAEERHSAKLQTQLAKAQTVNHSLQVQLDSISKSRNDQKAETQTRIVTVTKLIHDAEGRAQKVEAAPLPGQCKSPPEVLGADL